MRTKLSAVAIRVGVFALLFSLGGALELAHATPGTFGVSRFTIEPTEAKEVKQIFEGKEFTGPKYSRFLDEPYSFTQAGGHPFAITTTIELNSQKRPDVLEANVPVGGDPKDVVVNLPEGLIGNPLSVPRCAIADFTETAFCPASTQIGIAEIEFESSLLVEDVYNLAPEEGESAEIGIPGGGNFNFLVTGHVVREDHAYELTVVSKDLPMRGYTRFKVSIWGVTADPSHDPERGLRCETPDVQTQPVHCEDFGTLTHEGGEPAGVAAVPFWSMPENCSSHSRGATVAIDTWENPGHYVSGPEANLPQPTGCDALSFTPLVEFMPETRQPDSATGAAVKLRVPQPELPSLSSTPPVRDASVTLPAGVSVNPSAANGLVACQQSGPEGINIEGAESEHLGRDAERLLTPGKCPENSIIGTVEAKTPLLSEPVRGHLFLAKPECGGSGEEACDEQDAVNGRLYHVYMELGGAGELGDQGVNVKLPGIVSVNPASGQITTTFKDNPPFPFSDLKVRLKGGPQASLATPQSCGDAVTTADFTPWSAPGDLEGVGLIPGTADANPSSFFSVEGCVDRLAPAFTAGTVVPRAGAYSAFTMNLARKDGEQDLSAIQLHTPPGLVGMLSNVPLCKEPEASLGTCPESSRIGGTRVAAGAGESPYVIGGAVYLTTGYKAAPFGLSVVTHAIAGPFNLGLVVVRARIDIDPNTSVITVTSDPFPQILFGVPLRLQHVTVNIDRPDFIFNPTNCSAMQINASVVGSQNAVAGVSSPFAVAGCRNLAFAPTFKVSTSGRTSRSKGASLDTKVSFPATEPGTEANFAMVKVSLPKQLPSRLSTLQQACTHTTFEHNPAACPAASVVGIARASTPVLPVQLEGPAYFVSHGGEQFPSLVVVLEGDGVRVDLTGATFINKANITSSTFRSIPDVPVRSFELYLPEGKFSALGANANLCRVRKTVVVKQLVRRRVQGKTIQVTVRRRKSVPASLLMPTEFRAQNGKVIHQNTQITVTGCQAQASLSKAKIDRGYAR